MSLNKRFVAMVVTVALGISLIGAIPVLAAAPSITGVVITPDPAYINSLLQATPQGWYDEDGDDPGYQWQWQKYNTDESLWENIDGAESDQLDLNSTLYIGGEEITVIVGDQFKVICTPDDGTDTGDHVEATITISVLSYDAGIDIKPGSEENPINLKSKGVIPVVIYTTEGFDATTVDIDTVKLGPNEASPVHFAYEDVDDDGDIDLILHFRTQDTGIAEGDTEVTLTGETDSGTAFTGTVVIKIVPAKAQESVQGNESTPGQNKEPGESAEGKAKGKESAPGQNKEPGESAEGKAKGKNK
jgi:hypothetical protein